MSIETISLSGRKKVVSNKEMTFWERMYLIAILKGLWTTLKHLFTRKVTIKYPEETREFSPVYRGQHMLMRDVANAVLPADFVHFHVQQKP